MNASVSVHEHCRAQGVLRGFVFGLVFTGARLLGPNFVERDDFGIVLCVHACVQEKYSSDLFLRFLICFHAFLLEKSP